MRFVDFHQKLLVENDAKVGLPLVLESLGKLNGDHEVSPSPTEN